MLPEKLSTAIEIGSLKAPREETQSIKISTRRRPPVKLMRLISIAVSLSISILSFAVILTHLVSKESTVVPALIEAMLCASFPAPLHYDTDLPTSVIQVQDPEDPTEEEPTANEVSPPDTQDTVNETVDTNEKEPPTENAPTDEPEKSIYDFDLTVLPEGSMPIIPTDLSMPTDDRFYLSNETPYNPDLASLLARDNAVAVWKGEGVQKAPLVLIIHTHATEAYSEDGALWYDADTVAPRTEDITKNVVAVGSVMAEVFRDEGIPTLHCTILHDKEAYKDSYNRAAATIKSYLEKYPSIKYVFDVHRDSLIREDGEKLRPIAEIDGRAAAQVMSVVGTDYKGAPHADWESNLSLAAKLLCRLDESYTSLSRRINLRGASFNQQYTSGSLLLEIGSCGNSLEEAKFSAELVAKELSKIIKEG